MDRINNSLSGAERKAALCMLLDQETQLLSAIDRHKLETGTDNKQQRIQDFLDKVRELVSNIESKCVQVIEGLAIVYDFGQAMVGLQLELARPYP